MHENVWWLIHNEILRLIKLENKHQLFLLYGDIFVYQISLHRATLRNMVDLKNYWVQSVKVRSLCKVIVSEATILLYTQIRPK